MVVFSPFVLLLCTLWELCARFFNRYSAFTDQKKKKMFQVESRTTLFEKKDSRNSIKLERE